MNHSASSPEIDVEPLIDPAAGEDEARLADFWCENHLRDSCVETGSTRRARRPVWPFILNLRQTGLLSAVVMTLVVLTREPARQVEESPIWSIPTGHLHGVEAAAFSPDGQRLAGG
jgi:hypothetical protein